MAAIALMQLKALIKNFYEKNVFDLTDGFLKSCHVLLISHARMHHFCTK